MGRANLRRGAKLHWYIWYSVSRHFVSRFKRLPLGFDSWRTRWMWASRSSFRLIQPNRVRSDGTLISRTQGPHYPYHVQRWVLFLNLYTASIHFLGHWYPCFGRDLIEFFAVSTKMRGLKFLPLLYIWTNDYCYLFKPIDSFTTRE